MTTSRPAPIPEETQRFILLAIPSVPCLEALLLLRGAPDSEWNAVQVGDRLYLGEDEAAGLLIHLCAVGVATVDGGGSRFRYAPQSEQMVSLIDGLATIYSRNLIGVSNLIHSKLDTKARQFAGAFVFRKQTEDN